MAQQHISVGTPPDGVDGDTVRSAMSKAEANFTELYANVDAATIAADDAQTAATNAQTAATNAQTAATNAQTAANNAAAAAALIEPGYISGLKLIRSAGTTLSVTTGCAARPSDGLLMSPASAIIKSALVLTASTWYHVYLYMNGGNPDIEIVTTAPDAPYNGTARAKTGDLTRRYLGSIITDTAGAIHNFRMNGQNYIGYQTNMGDVPFTVVATGRSTAVTNVACSGVVPPTSRLAKLILAMIGAADAPMGNSEMTGTLSTTNYMQYLASGVQTTHDMELDANQAFSYKVSATISSGGFYARVAGYFFER